VVVPTNRQASDALTFITQSVLFVDFFGEITSLKKLTGVQATAAN